MIKQMEEIKPQNTFFDSIQNIESFFESERDNEKEFGLKAGIILRSEVKNIFNDLDLDSFLGELWSGADYKNTIKKFKEGKLLNAISLAYFFSDLTEEQNIKIKKYLNTLDSNIQGDENEEVINFLTQETEIIKSIFENLEKNSFANFTEKYQTKTQELKTILEKNKINEGDYHKCKEILQELNSIFSALEKVLEKTEIEDISKKIKTACEELSETDETKIGDFKFKILNLLN